MVFRNHSVRGVQFWKPRVTKVVQTGLWLKQMLRIIGSVLSSSHLAPGQSFSLSFPTNDPGENQKKNIFEVWQKKPRTENASTFSWIWVKMPTLSPASRWLSSLFQDLLSVSHEGFLEGDLVPFAAEGLPRLWIFFAGRKKLWPIFF